MFRLDLLAEAALCGFKLSDVDKSHAAGLSSSILIVALVGEASPAPVSTCEPLLVVETHAYQIGQRRASLGLYQTYLIYAMKVFQLQAPSLLDGLFFRFSSGGIDRMSFDLSFFMHSPELEG